MRVLTSALACTVAMAALSAVPDARSTVGERVQQLTRDSSWKAVASVPIGFRTFHPQGMVKIGDRVFVSSVEVRVPPERLPRPVDGYDRDPGEGVGHLFAIDLDGHLVADLPLGEGTIYHPGGLDYDGTNIWVPVAEYRPNSRSIVYRVDPRTMRATEVLRFADHIGAIVHDTDDHTLHGVSWGSRRFYRWTLGRDGRVTNARTPPEALRTLNTSHYVDYQDCKYAGRRRMLCTGVTEMRQARDAPPFRLGGLDLVSLEDGRPLHQVPVLLWTAGGVDMTHNPVWIEPFDAAQGGPFDAAQGRPFGTAQGRPFGTAQGRPSDAAQARPFDAAQGRPFGTAQGRPFGTAQGRPFDAAQGRPFGTAQGRPFDAAHGARGLRAYFMPEDDRSTLYIYEVETQ